MSTSIPPDSRFVHRRWWRRLRRWGPWVVALTGVAVMAGAGWLLFATSHFTAENVDVSGARQLSKHQVRAAADVAADTPLLRLDLDEIHDRVAAVPEVATVEVHRSWPNTVRIVVTERQPVAVVRGSAEWWAMDNQGALFSKSPERPQLPDDVPVLEVAKMSDAAARREVAAVVDALPPDLVARLEGVSAASMDSITLRLRGGRSVLWGSSADSDLKAEVLGVLLAQSRAEVFDVSVPQQPTSAAAGAD